MRFVISFLACFLLLAACSRESGDSNDGSDGSSGARAERAASTAVLKKDIDLASCLADENADNEATSSCPTYILQSLDYMIDDCRRANGELQAAAESNAWSLDVDSDGETEVLLDLTQNFDCQGAPSVFYCASPGCPYFLYTHRGEAWDELGAVNADDAPAIDVMPAKPGESATLRGGCSGERPCRELAYYTWNGDAYDRSLIEFRGQKVDVAPGGLWTLTRNIAVRAAPSAHAVVLDEYPMGTTVVVIGAARSAPYKFVSPCNGCRRGFVDAEALKK